MTTATKKKDVWTKDGRELELFASTYNDGNRNSAGGIAHKLLRSRNVKVRGAKIGISGFASRDDAHRFLREKGWAPVCAA